MAYDPSTRTITVGKDEDFLLDSAEYFYDMFCKFKDLPTASDQMKDDFTNLQKWLDESSRQSGSDYKPHLRKAWQAYLAVGVAPSFELQPLFDSKKNNELAKGKPPVKIMDIFDRMLATDKDIAIKRQADIEHDKRLIESALKNFPKANNQKEPESIGVRLQKIVQLLSVRYKTKFSTRVARELLVHGIIGAFLSFIGFGFAINNNGRMEFSVFFGEGGVIAALLIWLGIALIIRSIVILFTPYKEWLNGK